MFSWLSEFSGDGEAFSPDFCAPDVAPKYRQSSTGCVQLLLERGAALPSSPNTVHKKNHPCRVARAVVHGDDFVFTRTDVDLDSILVELTSKYEISNRGRLENGPTDAQNIDVLGRVVRLQSSEYSVIPVRDIGTWSWNSSA